MKIPQCIAAIPESLYDSIYNQTSQLWRNSAPLQTALGYRPLQRVSSDLLLYIFYHPAWSQFIARVYLQAMPCGSLCNDT
jgi:hypothetical protein